MNECVYVIRNLLVMHGCQATKNVGGLASQTWYPPSICSSSDSL